MDTILLVMLLRLLLGVSDPEAYFEFADANEDRFVFKLVHAAKIAHARSILDGRSSEMLSVSGKIVKKPASYNPGWGYHLKPRSIHFFDFAIEVCDSSILYVQENLKDVGGAFLPGGRWCPWTSRLTREVTVEVYLRELVRGPQRLWPVVFGGFAQRAGLPFRTSFQVNEWLRHSFPFADE